MTYKIARRAYGEYTVVETGIASWVEAANRAMTLQAEKQDGEYFEFREEQEAKSHPNEYCAVQTAFAYL